MPKRAILVGCGAMAKGWLKAVAETPALRSGIEVVGLVDVNLAAADGLKEEFGLVATTGTDLEAMLTTLKPDVIFDVVIPGARHDVVTADKAKISDPSNLVKLEAEFIDNVIVQTSDGLTVWSATP